MIINKLILKNFRIFNGMHEFNFSNSKVIVIEGSNGHGKSTVFDAINWVLSGKIDRYTGSSEYQKFNYLINTTAYKKENSQASVEIILKENEEEISIKRLIKNNSMKLFINSVEYKLNEGQKKIGELLVRESRGKLIDGLEDRKSKVDMSAFLASTTILSQEGLENFVRSDRPVDRYTVLEKVLGLSRYGEDFKHFLKKLEKTNEESNEELEKSKNHIKQKKDLLETKYKEKVKHENRLGKINEEDLIKEINSFLSEVEKDNKALVRLTGISEKEISILKKIKKENLESINQLKEINDSIKRNYLINLSSGLIEDNIKKSEQKNVEFYTKRSKRIQNVKKSEERKNKLINISKALKRIETIEEDIWKNDLKTEEIVTYKENVLIELLKKYDEEDLKDITDFTKKYDNWKNMLEQHNRLTEYLKNRKKLKEIEEGKKINEESLIELSKQKILKKDKLRDIDLKLNELSIKQRNKKESHVNRIVNEIQEKIIDSKDIQSCMVCGTYFNTEIELKETVMKQLTISHEDLNELEKKVRKKDLKKATIINENEEIFDDIKKIETSINAQKRNMTEISEKNTGLLARIDPEIKEISIESLSKRVKGLEELIKKYAYKYNFAKELERIQLDLDKIIKDKKAFKQDKNNILSENNLIKKYIDNPDLIMFKLLRINNYINTAKTNIKELENHENDEKVIILEEKRKRKLLIEYLNNVKDILSLDYIDLDGKVLNSLINKHLEKMIKNNEKFDYYNREMVSYLNMTELSSLEKNILKYSGKFNEIQKSIDRHNVLNSQLIKFTKNHREVQSDLINKYLDELTEEINSFYQQISPHAYYDFLRLHVEENELFILLAETEFKKSTSNDLNLKDSINASLTLSAAQSTVLAMSIFLALNTSQNWSKLEVIGIDDPFQNLDDINIYSFIDVINVLVKEEKKQIFISTHHQDFSKLIASKLGYKDSQLSHISFQSYTREKISVKSNCYKYLDNE